MIRIISVNRVSNWVKQEGSFIFWLTLLNLTYIENFYANNHGRYLLLEIIKHGTLRVFAPVIIFDILILLIFGHWKRLCRAVKIFFLTVNVFSFIVDMFTIFYYGIPLDRAMLEVALTTNFREGSEFLEMYIFNLNLWGLLVAVAVAMILLRYLYSMLLERKNGLAVLCSAFMIMFVISVCSKSLTKGNPQKSIAVFRLISIFQGIHRDRADLREMENGIPDEIILTRNESKIPHIVFILGESTNRNHMSLYGYSLPTNPYLLKRQHEGGMYIFNDVISPHAHTMIVLEKLFTFYRYGDEKNWFNYANLFSILNSAGYRTFWLSNQESAIIGVVGKFFAGKCSVSRFTILKDHGDDVITYDEEILPILDEILSSSSSEKNFYVLHLMGTHMSYHYRYPENFSKFTFADEGGFDGIDNSQKAVRAEYDNAVLYNDFVVNEIIRRFEAENAIVIYVSDHGEEIYDKMNFSGHEEIIDSSSMIEIPMIIWLSERFMEAFPDIERRIADSVNRPFMTDDMIHVILDIAGIETSDYKPQLSVINEAYDVSRERIASGRHYEK